jgi:fatty acid desaturase
MRREERLSMAHAEKDRLIESHEPRWSSVFVLLGFFLAFCLLQGVVVWSMIAGAWWLTILAVLSMAHLMHGHLLAFHEAAHGSLCPNHRLNDALGVFIGILSFMGFSLYRAAHHSHHSYLGTERDEELWPFVKTDKPRWFRFLAAMSELFLGLIYTPLLFFRALIRPGSIIQNRNRRRRIWIELGLMAATWGFILALVAYEGWYSYLLMMYVIPATLAGFMQSLRKYIEHMGLNGSTVLSSTRSVVDPGLLGRFLSFTLFNEPYHGVHHKYARLPYEVLPQFVDDLIPADVAQAELTPEREPFPTYRHAMLDMLPSLLDPKVGAQWVKVDPERGQPIINRMAGHSHLAPHLEAATQKISGNADVQLESSGKS